MIGKLLNTLYHLIRRKPVPNYDWEKIAASPRVVILVGLPGSGKSTYANSLVQKYGWVRINQDELGNRHKCKAAATKALQEGKSIIIDRCNFNPSQRQVWTNLALEYFARIDCVWLDVSYRECLNRALNRKDHPTLSNSVDIKRALNRMRKDFVAPSYSEEFDLIIRY